MPTPTQICLDQLSVERIKKLHPKLRSDALTVFTEITGVLTGRAMCRITFGLRTMDEQRKLYEQGRITRGPIVTNAKPGQSYHNYGLAVDFAMIIDGRIASWDVKTDWDGDRRSDWMEVVDIFKKHGWDWGGDWKTFRDMPHFEKRFGYHWKKLLELHQAGKIDKEGYVLI